MTPLKTACLSLLCLLGCDGYWDRGRQVLPGDAAPDRSLSKDRGQDRGSPDSKPTADLKKKPDAHVQGVACAGGKVTFKADRPPRRGKTFSLVVTGPPVGWPQAGVTVSKQKPPPISSFKVWTKTTLAFKRETHCKPKG